MIKNKMYPASVGNQWLNSKCEPVEEPSNVGNVTRSWQWRERGIDPPNYASNKKVLENIAEDILVRKSLEVRSCDLPGYPRSTFLMVFSPDGTKVASTHGNHNVYVSELSSGKHVRILKGHPRTPWCIAFHPSHPQLIGSGCLGGQVRVWDIASGGSEVWNVRNETVIASIAFHPREQLLVIATYNELYFWDWSQPAPLARVSTNNVNEKVRYVAFDSLGYKLITGISLWACQVNSSTNPLLSQNLLANNSTSNSNNNSGNNGNNGGNGNNGNNGGNDNDGNNGGNGNNGRNGNNEGNGGENATNRENDDSNRPSENPGAAQDMIVNSYQTLVQRYDSLVRNYQRLFMVRHRLTNTPPTPNTTDRGTDPMETYPWRHLDNFRRRRAASLRRRASGASRRSDPLSASPSTSTRQDGGDSGEGESSSRLLNLDVLSFDSDASRNQDSPNQERSTFGSSSSAFQPLNEPDRSIRFIDHNERTTRLLPNPFFSTGNSPRQTRFSDHTDSSNNPNSSRTSIFTTTRAESLLSRDFALRRRNSPMPQNGESSTRNRAESASTSRAATSGEPQPSTSRVSTQTPTTTNSSTQMSPDGETQSINESLDLIRDILRDSGSRLLNLITNMSMNILSNSDQGEDGEQDGTRRPRPRLRLFSGDLRRDFLPSSSDSESDHTEVNIRRTPNTGFREGEPDAAPRPSTSHTTVPTDRMVFELSADEPDRRDSSLINISMSNRRFRVRTQSAPTIDDAPTTDREPVAGPSGVRPRRNAGDPARPSTSADNLLLRGPEDMSSAEAYRRVRAGVNMLQKHTFELANMWLRGPRVDRSTIKQLRLMWENLRRRIVALRRDTGRHNPPIYYTRSLIERCMILTEMTDMASRQASRISRSGARTDNSERTTETNASNPENPGPSNGNVERRERSRRQGESREPTTSAAPENGPEPTARSQRMERGAGRGGRGGGTRSASFLRRRLQPSYRPRFDDERRRRYYTATANRLSRQRSTDDFSRAIEMTATRHEIRMRAMQVLSVMFNTMMMCLEVPGLSQLIINMLKTLKKALALTCFMLVSNRNVTRPGSNPTQPTQGVESEDVVRIQNVEHPGPVNVDGPDEPASPRITPPTEESEEPNAARPKTEPTKTPTIERPSTSRSMEQVAPVNELPSSSPSPNAVSQRWSHRLAVQIAAANRNNSATARTRRELYLESRRQKALHRTNPTVHPPIKKRIPPVSSHRIPVLRSLPRSVDRTPRLQPSIYEPVPGPSTVPPSSNDADRDSPPRNRDLSEFDNRRESFIRIAHMQAVRLRNAARNRIRRLQTIRLYTPSSVREIFAFQPGNGEQPNSGEQSNNGERSNGTEQNAASTASNVEQPIGIEIRPPGRGGGDGGIRRSINVTFSPNMFPLPQEIARQQEAELRAIVNNVALPLIQMNDIAPAAEPQPQRLPRIHEYLQPIILAQNAMVVEEEGEGGGGGGGGGGGAGGGGARRLGGMAGLLDAGIISEALPAPSHRVQAWDFTTGAAPQISDSTKNVVVARCRIHNDASIDISKDGRLLVALLPVPRLRNTNKCLGVYSLEWARLGQCLHTAALEQSAVSVALSPSARYLAVGLGSRRFTSAGHARNNVIALLYKLEESIETTNRPGLQPIKELEQHWEHGFTSLNCLRWAPQPGQGLVYANNTGQLIIMS